ncbi:MAG: hypothetical protein GXO50_07450, partial [Chlorobi bacterium]|nr:hypothetical protein [Chlorobiota bacterium]
MKNYIILISVLFLFLQAVSRNTVSESEYTLPDSIILVKDSVYYYIYKSGNEILYAREKTSYINEDGDILSYIYQTLNSVSGIWNNSELYNLTYNTYGLNIGKLKRIWDVRQKAWLPYENSIFEYDGNGNKIRNIYITWDSEISDWSNNLREDFKYDTSGMLTEYILFEGKDLGHDWQNLKKNTYAYNEQGNIEEYISYLYDINSASWINSDKEEYIYDLNNFLISLLIKKWDDDFNIWR